MSPTILSLLRSTFFQIATSAIRAGLVFGVGWMTAKDWLNASLASQILAVVPMLAVSVVWSYVEKFLLARWHAGAVNVALSLPANSTEDDLMRAMGGDGARNRTSRYPVIAEIEQARSDLKSKANRQNSQSIKENEDGEC